MLAIELINRAWILSGIVARDLEPVSGSQGADGLFLLNALLSQQNITSRYIPYNDEQTFTAVIGQEKYEIDNLVSLDTLTFVKDSVRYPMIPFGRKRYFGSGRANNINSLMYSYFFQRAKGVGQIYLYFKPDQPYTVTMNGKFALLSVASDDDLSDVFDEFYIIYLMYELTLYMASWYNQSVPDTVQQKILEFRQSLPDLNQLDFEPYFTSSISNYGGFNYANVNLGKGWVP
jgi:hypothetical protein